MITYQTDNIETKFLYRIIHVKNKKTYFSLKIQRTLEKQKEKLLFFNPFQSY